MPTELPVIVNPAARRSRRGSAAIDKVVATLTAHGSRPRIVSPSNVTGAESAVAAEVAAGTPRIVLVGGDGTIHRCLGPLAYSNTTVGFIPAGTGNDLTRALGIPLDPTLAARAALEDPIEIDLLRVGETWAASVAAAGFAADVTASSERFTAAGPARYTAATLLEIGRLQVRQVELTIDGERHAYDAAMVAIANTGYFGAGMRIAPSADPTDGMADIIVVADISRRRLARFFPYVFVGRHTSLPEVMVLRGSRVLLSIRGDVWADGELVGPAPMEFRVAPAALRVAGAKPIPAVPLTF